MTHFSLLVTKIILERLSLESSNLAWIWKKKTTLLAFLVFWSSTTQMELLSYSKQASSHESLMPFKFPIFTSNEQLPKEACLVMIATVSHPTAPSTMHLFWACLAIFKPIPGPTSRLPSPNVHGSQVLPVKAMSMQYSGLDSTSKEQWTKVSSSTRRC
jgi:hypothetical protein